MKILKQLFCDHEYKLLRTIHGDERNYATTQWKCQICEKYQFSWGSAEKHEIKKSVFKKMCLSLRKSLGALGLLLLCPEQKKALLRDWKFQQEVREVEAWMCEYPQAVAIARRLRVRVNGYRDTLPANHPDRAASSSISAFRDSFKQDKTVNKE